MVDSILAKASEPSSIEKKNVFSALITGAKEKPYFTLA